MRVHASVRLFAFVRARAFVRMCALVREHACVRLCVSRCVQVGLNKGSCYRLNPFFITADVRECITLHCFAAQNRASADHKLIGETAERKIMEAQ